MVQRCPAQMEVADTTSPDREFWGAGIQGKDCIWSDNQVVHTQEYPWGEEIHVRVMHTVGCYRPLAHWALQRHLPCTDGCCCRVESVVSDSVRPHRWQPTRLHRPWDFPGKNTGVGCHFLLQCMKGKSESEVTQLCPTLCDPMDCSLPGPSIHGIFHARVLEWGAMSFSDWRMSNYKIHTRFQRLYTEKRM